MWGDSKPAYTGLSQQAGAFQQSPRRLPDHFSPSPLPQACKCQQKRVGEMESSLPCAPPLSIPAGVLGGAGLGLCGREGLPSSPVMHRCLCSGSLMATMPRTGVGVKLEPPHCLVSQDPSRRSQACEVGAPFPPSPELRVWQPQGCCC